MLKQNLLKINKISPKTKKNKKYKNNKSIFINILKMTYYVNKI